MSGSNDITLRRFHERFDRRHDELREDLLGRLGSQDRPAAPQRTFLRSKWAVAGAIAAAGCLVGIALALWGPRTGARPEGPPAGLSAVARPASMPALSKRPTTMLVGFSLFDLVIAPAKWGFLNQHGEIVVKARFERVANFSEGLAAVRLDGKWGFIDRDGKIAIEPRFGAVKSFHEGIAAATVGKDFKSWKWGYIDMTGKFVIEPQFNWVGVFAEGLARVKIRGKGFGFIDRTGRLALEPQYGYAFPFSEGLAPVQDDSGRYGLIDCAGNWVVQPQFEKMGWSGLEEGLAAFGSGGKWGFFDRTGRVVVPSIYDGDMYGFAGGLARVKVGKKYGYIDRTGRMVIEPRYVSASRYFSEGLAVVCEKWGGPWSFISRTGKVVFTIEAEGVSGVSAVSDRFSNGMVWFRLGHQAKTRYGFMDRTGKVVIPASFEHLGGDFSEGLATFASGLKW